MRKFVHTAVFKKMNVGYCLDEGLANPGDAYTVFYAEREMWCECVVGVSRVVKGPHTLSLSPLQFLISPALGRQVMGQGSRRTQQLKKWYNKKQ